MNISTLSGFDYCTYRFLVAVLMFVNVMFNEYCAISEEGMC